MMAFLLVGAGGFIGANIRFAISTWAAGRFGAGFPSGTLIANLAGSFLMGFLLGWVSGWLSDADTHLILATGILGSETTFSTFSFESVALMRQGDWRLATLNVLGNVIPGLIAATLGLLGSSALGAA